MSVHRSAQREHAAAVLRRLRDAGFEALFAGGCVRDELLGREPKDYDIATSAPPDAVEGLFPDTKAVGKAFGVILVIDGPLVVEVATFRKDLGYRDGRRPEGVVFTSAEEDARRRDFTVNGLFLDPLAHRVIDFVGGEADLRARTIRAIGNPDDRFNEDHLRILRAARFAATLGFTIDPPTADAMRRHAAQLAGISAERIQHELTRLLTEAQPGGDGIRRMDETGLLPVVLPEIAAMKGVTQPPQFHPEGDVFTHTLLMLDGMASPSPLLAWSVLLHDVGKPPTFRISIEPDGSERIRFDNHADVGADMAEAILRRLRCSNDLVEGVTHCVRGHMRFMHVQQMRKATLRKLLASPTFETELELHRLDCSSSHRDLSNHLFLDQARAAWKAEPVLPEPWINGRDILALGVPEGPRIGAWRQRAYDRQLEGGAASREELLAWVRERMATEGA